METSNGLEPVLQEGKLYRDVNALIVAHLRDNNLNQAASAVASATMTPLNVEAPPNKLLELVAKGLAVEKDEMQRGVSSSALFDSGAAIAGGYGSIPAPRAIIDFSAVHNTKGLSKIFPSHETRNITEHKNVARCARFSPDGRFLATGSADTSIKLLEVPKIKQIMMPDSKEGSVRPVTRTFYDHLQPINDLDFHPSSTVLISGAKDHTIKFFDFSKPTAKRAYRVIQDTHNVRSVCFHPSGNFVLAGTDHPIAHLYDVNTFQCYISTEIQAIGVTGAINQVRYSTTGGMYVTASKDGSIRIWDGVTANCVRTIAAHSTAEAVSAAFTKDERFVLSCGKDSSVKLWEVGTGRLVKQYLGATHTQLRCQAVLSDTEEFVLSIDEPSNEIVIWNSLTAEKVAKWPSQHSNGAPCWLEHSPIESAFVSCGNDRSIRFWKEAP